MHTRRIKSGFTLIELPVVRKGFTLIELLVVVAIITALIAILLPSMGRSRELARVAVCGSNQRQVGVGLISYAISNKDALPPWRDDTQVNNVVHRWMYRDGDGWENLGLLYESKNLLSGAVYFCPSQEYVGFTFENYAPWPTFSGYDGTSVGTLGIRSGFQYNPHLENEATTSPRLYRKLVEMPRSATLAADLMEHRLAIAHAKLAGWNLLTPDGSVLLKRNEQVLDQIPVWWDQWLPQSKYYDLLEILERS